MHWKDINRGWWQDVAVQKVHLEALQHGSKVEGEAPRRRALDKPVVLLHIRPTSSSLKTPWCALARALEITVLSYGRKRQGISLLYDLYRKQFTHWAFQQLYIAYRMPPDSQKCYQTDYLSGLTLLSVDFVFLHYCIHFFSFKLLKTDCCCLQNVCLFSKTCFPVPKYAKSSFTTLKKWGDKDFLFFSPKLNIILKPLFSHSLIQTCYNSNSPGVLWGI